MWFFVVRSRVSDCLIEFSSRWSKTAEMMNVVRYLFEDRRKERGNTSDNNVSIRSRWVLSSLASTRESERRGHYPSVAVVAVDGIDCVGWSTNVDCPYFQAVFWWFDNTFDWAKTKHCDRRIAGFWREKTDGRWVGSAVWYWWRTSEVEDAVDRQNRVNHDDWRTKLLLLSGLSYRVHDEERLSR